MQAPRYQSPPPLGGLPTGPRMRPGTVRRDDGASRTSSSRSFQEQSAPRSLRSQRSFAALPRTSDDRGRSRGDESSPLPPSVRSKSVTRPRARDFDADLRSSVSSSGSSTGSSMMDRMRIRSNDTTPRTSLDEEYPPMRMKREAPPRGYEHNKSGETYDQEDFIPPDDTASGTQSNGGGASLWGRMVVAAGNLSINVSQAWTSNIATYSGEETPPGQDSRLTRAMKAYHLAQAQKPSDLPEWLFEPHERGMRTPWGGVAADNGNDGGDVSRTPSAPMQVETRSGVVRNVYNATGPDPAGIPVSRSRYEDPNPPAPSTATSRLKALRDAKRQANGGRVEAPVVVQELRAPPSTMMMTTAPTKPRVGLPTGPGRVRGGRF